MATCVKCGAPLREGAKFCGACGAKAELRRFCTQCGEPLEPGEKFCAQCGAPVEDAPAPAVPGASREKKPDFPDVRGFYGDRHKAVSVSDEALVWYDNSAYCLYRLDRDWTLHSAQPGQLTDVIQTRDGVLALHYHETRDGTTLVLKTLDKHLSLLSERPLCEIPAGDAVEECCYFMTQFDLFVLQYTMSYDAQTDRDRSTDVFLRQIDLATGETREWKWDRLEWKGWAVCFDDLPAFLGVDGERPCLSVGLQKGEDNERAVLIFDPRTGSFSSLWQGRGDDGRPMFFDWKKHIMWTRPTRAEAESRVDVTERSLVARKLAPNSPMLSNLSVWQEYHGGSYFTYFDGEHAYYAPSYFQFFAYTQSGAQSEDWNQSGHGRAETAVVWPQADKIVMDLMADYRYTVYPMAAAKPGHDELISLRQEN